MAAEIPGSKDTAPPRNAETQLESVRRVIPEMVAGSLKGATVDLLGLPVDMINEVLGAVGLKSSRPIGGSEHLRSIHGIKSGKEDTAAEIGGSFISPAGAAKAMIVGAARVLRKEGVAEEAIGKIMQTARDARDMEMAGVKADVFNTTGTYAVKSDDVVRSVVSDVKASLMPGTLVTTEARGLRLAPDVNQLSDILRHDELYALYPELKNYKVRNDPSLATGAARHIPDSRVMEFGSQRAPEMMLSAILHETQHAVQTASGMQAGASTKDFRKFPRPSQKVLKEVMKDVSSKDEILKKYAEKFLTKVNEQEAIAYEKYLNVPGEVEARMTQANRGMTQEELNNEVTRLISNDVPHNLWDK